MPVAVLGNGRNGVPRATDALRRRRWFDFLRDIELFRLTGRDEVERDFPGLRKGI